LTTATKVKARFTFPLNFRDSDREILEALEQIAKRNETNLTTIIRGALKEYALGKSGKIADTIKIDSFFGDNVTIDKLPAFQKVNSPEMFRQISDSELLTFAKMIRSRKQETEGELRKRRFYFTW